MKKVLLVVAMLLAASQVMAGVTITAVNEGTFVTPGAPTERSATIRVDYTGDINVRAFALDINVDSGANFWGIRDFKVGENNGTNNGYGIFPGRFRQFINPQNPAWGDANGNSNYNPTPPWADPGTTNTGIGFGVMIVEMGYLGAGDANKPPMSGTLFRADINAYAFEGTATVTISADAMRGGVVDKDTNATTTAVTYVPVSIVFPASCVTIPNVIGLDRAVADACLTGLGFTTNPTASVSCTGTYNAVLTQDSGCYALPHVVNYSYEAGKTVANEVGVATATAEAAWIAQGFTIGTKTQVVDCTKVGLVISHDTGCKAQGTAIAYSYGIAQVEPNVVNMTRANAVAALVAAGYTVSLPDVNGWGGSGVTTVGKVFAQNPPAGTSCGATAVTLSVVSHPIKPTAPNAMYTNWLGRGRPICWAYPRQCHGDADGKKVGTWVSSGDLTILRSAITKVDSLIPAGGICADFDHKKVGTWVSSGDLTILRQYITKLDTAVPVCGNTAVTTDPNFWYWCLPTGGTCPAGQVCAPVGACPNTP